MGGSVRQIFVGVVFVAMVVASIVFAAFYLFHSPEQKLASLGTIRTGGDDRSPVTTAPVASAGSPDHPSRSTRLSNAARQVKFWQPETPADVVAGFDGTNPSLVEWMQEWQAKIAAGRTEDIPNSRDQLDKALASSDVTVDQCKQMVILLSKWESTNLDEKDSPYHCATAGFACKAIYATTAIVDSDPQDRSKPLTDVAPLIKRLWNGPPEDAKAVEAFYTLLAKYEPIGSPEWHRGHLGAAEAMAAQGRLDDSIAATIFIERQMPEMSPAQKAPVLYARGSAQFRLDRYREASESLEAAIPNLQPAKRGDARALLIMADSRCNRIDDAKRHYLELANSGDSTQLKDQAALTLGAAEGSLK